jgi:hypothetical protein
MQKFRGVMLLIAAAFAIYVAIARVHGLRSVTTAAIGVIVGVIGVLRLVQKRAQ